MVAPGSNALNDILGPLAACLTPEAAQRLVSLRFDAAARAKYEALAAKANEGALSDAERGDYLDYIEAMDLVGILQAKARESLARPASR